MSSVFITNARISGADIVFEKGFILSAWVHLDFDHSGQGFGGFALGGSPFDKVAMVASHHEQPNLAADFIGGVMVVAGVNKWSDLKDKIVRVRKTDEWAAVDAIGHPVKDIWYNPNERFAQLKNEREA
ncbi:hypothetical protein GRI39_02120 [Altererythrobacter indicus]|uniref:Uncharacterized protein n=1 Tax=Altericroceibacterium indicum TaxID=374177 RepID=A0A845A6F5_9SPHN|nr:hypothetical protein [Altericroceibacterium indicum]MXP24843.1 hypothetical protein [Altericroceibacterium indicum]